MSTSRLNETNDKIAQDIEELFLPERQRQILRKSSICSKLNDEQALYFFEVVERTRLDPFTGQIRPDVRLQKTGREDERGKEIKEPTLLIITTLQGLRATGERTGLLAGESKVEWCGKNGEWVDVWLQDIPPSAARASVFRKDRPGFPQTHVVRFDAFVQEVYDKYGNKVPGPFWIKMGSHMLGKCCLAGCYRGAFPIPCSGLYISEELRQELDPDSEEAIEAEMIRRARSEQQYWDEQAKNGVYPVGKEPPGVQSSHDTTEPSRNGMVGTAAAPVLGQVSEQKPEQTGQHWSDFKITRINRFKNRTVGSLTVEELVGSKVFLEKVEEHNWEGLDDDVKAHYNAIKARITYEAQLEDLNNEFDFTKR
jgi:hypothetical protein